MELKQEIKNSLKQVIEKEKGKIYHTGELRVIDLAKDCLDAIEQLEKDATAYRELMSKAEELDYLARIGRAMEKAFESGFSINQMHSVLSNVDYCMYDKESLLNWAEEEVSND